ncbi:hypothetical protein M758_3G158500 [Ceratodon purpureus]|nr:hypothetical protein M758_3G158500 [Ceratodon purpureus]
MQTKACDQLHSVCNHMHHHLPAPTLKDNSRKSMFQVNALTARKRGLLLILPLTMLANLIRRTSSSPFLRTHQITSTQTSTSASITSSAYNVPSGIDITSAYDKSIGTEIHTIVDSKARPDLLLLQPTSQIFRGSSLHDSVSVTYTCSIATSYAIHGLVLYKPRPVVEIIGRRLD